MHFVCKCTYFLNYLQTKSQKLIDKMDNSAQFIDNMKKFVTKTVWKGR